MSSPFTVLDREAWRRFGSTASPAHDARELIDRRGALEEIAVDELTEILLPLSHLLIRCLGPAPGSRDRSVAFIVGIGGGVAVGKSTLARVLCTLLERSRAISGVELLATDGFLFSNAELDARHLTMRKGFPETYDDASLVDVLAAVKAGDPHVDAPVYSHDVYDVKENERQTIGAPAVLVVEGLNVLQRPSPFSETVAERGHVADHLDFSIYVHAEEADLRRWYVERFLRLCAAAKTTDDSFFRRFADLDESGARTVAEHVWDAINGVNLRENIVPMRSRADLILEKGSDHRVRRVSLRDGAVAQRTAYPDA